MKHLLLSLSFIIGTALPSIGQQGRNLTFAPKAVKTYSPNSRSVQANVNYRAGVPIESSKQDLNRYPGPFAPQSTDVIISNNSTVNYRNVHIATAFNGWLFAVYSINDAVGGGVGASKSTDGGVTWTPLFGSTFAGGNYPSVDITVAGNNLSNLVYYVGGVLNNAGTYIAWLDKYAGASTNYYGENFNESTGTNLIYDIEIATDYQNPSVVSSPYSVAVIYTTTTTPADSLIYSVSLDSGTTYTTRNSFSTFAYLNKASIAYGYSANRNNGRYFVAFDSRPTIAASVGNIGFMHTDTDPGSTFTTPVYVDSADAGMTGMVRYASISCENEMGSADSSDVVAIITMDRQYSATDWDVLSMYSQRAVNSTISNWHRLDIDNAASVAISGDVAYSAAGDLFEATYYDSTSSHLVAVKTYGHNLSGSSTWAVINSQYNDVTTNLMAPKPQISISPSDTATNLAWNAEGSSANGVPMFDREALSSVGIPVAAAITTDFASPFPNPSSNMTSFAFTLQEQKLVTFTVYNMVGEIIFAQDLGLQSAGKHLIDLQVGSLPSGVYLYQYTVNEQVESGRFSVVH